MTDTEKSLDQLRADIDAELNRLGLKYEMSEDQRNDIAKGLKNYLNSLKECRMIYDHHVDINPADMITIHLKQDRNGPFTIHQPKKRQADGQPFTLDTSYINPLLDKEE